VLPMAALAAAFMAAAADRASCELPMSRR
jgi:hypothetical protein